MPPRTRKETPEAILMVDPEKPMLAPENEAPVHEIVKGRFVHIVINGQTRHKGAEVIQRDGMGLTIRTDSNGLTRAEISFVPWSAIEGIGIVGAR